MCADAAMVAFPTSVLDHQAISDEGQFLGFGLPLFHRNMPYPIYKLLFRFSRLRFKIESLLDG